MNILKQYLSEKESCSLVSFQQIKDLEKFADNLLKKFDIDVEFTKHFGERISDSRNTPCIKMSEIQQLFKKIAKDKGQKVLAHKDSEAVLKDIQSKLNLPFVLNVKKDGSFEMVAKTIMRKDNFKTPNPEVKYEAFVHGNMTFNRKQQHNLTDEEIAIRDKLIAKMVANPHEFREKYGSSWQDVITHAATRLVITKQYDDKDLEDETYSDSDLGEEAAVVINANKKQASILSLSKKGNANKKTELRTSLPEEQNDKS